MKSENSLYNLYKEAYHSHYPLCDENYRIKCNKDYDCVMRDLGVLNLLKEKKVDLTFIFSCMLDEDWSPDDILDAYNIYAWDGNLIALDDEKLTKKEMNQILNWLKRIK